MTPHAPDTDEANGGRRCNFTEPCPDCAHDWTTHRTNEPDGDPTCVPGCSCMRSGEAFDACNLLDYEHVPLYYIAIIPTKYEIVGCGETPEEAQEAAAAYWLSHRAAFTHPDHADLTTPQRVIDYFGANVYGPLVPGMAVSE